jgi:hypothetical protein
MEIGIDDYGVQEVPPVFFWGANVHVLFEK